MNVNTVHAYNMYAYEQNIIQNFCDGILNDFFIFSVTAVKNNNNGQCIYLLAVMLLFLGSRVGLRVRPVVVMGESDQWGEILTTP